MIRALMVSAVAIAMSMGTAASAATVTVDSMANSTTGGTGALTGVFLTIGQAFTVTAGLLDTWSLGSNDNSCTRESNADGLTTCTYNPYTQGGLTTAYGKLVGQINGGNFFAIGTNYSGFAGATGQLLLFNFDSNKSDNSGEIVATVTAVPLPAGGLLLLGALGGIAALRRRKSA